MKYRISDLLENMEICCLYEKDEYDSSAISTERIKEKTMEKINNSTKKSRPGPRRVFLIAAAVAVISTITAAAVVASRVSVRKLEAGELLQNDCSSFMSDGGESVITVAPQSEGNVICFRPEWLPEDAQCMEWSCTFSAHMPYYAEKTGKSPEEVMKTSGMTQEEGQKWYTSVWNNPEGTEMNSGEKGAGRFFRIDMFDGTTLDEMYLLIDREMTVVREGELNGMTACYMAEKPAAEHNGAIDASGSQNYILLYSEKLNCMVEISGTLDFEEMEKIANGLELRKTGLKALKGSGGYSFIRGGLG